MRIPVLSFCIAISIVAFSAPAVFAQNDKTLPGYANERFYPEDVTKAQTEGGFIYSVCSAVGGFGIFECEGLRSHQVIAPESVGVAENEIDTSQAFSIENQEKELARLENGLIAATTSAQILGIQDSFNNLIDRIFGGGGAVGQGFIDSYRPQNSLIGNPIDSAKVRTNKLRIALLPASMQSDSRLEVDPLDTDGDGFPDNPTDPTNPSDPENPPIDPQPPPTGESGYDLVQGFRRACIYGGVAGRVHETNVECLNTIVPRLSFGVVPELRNSALAYTNLQCVGFVRGMNLQFKGKALDNGGNAIDFATNIPTGYRLIHKITLTGISPRVGDLLLWNTGIGPYGHIAYISVVYDKDNVGVIEANWGTYGMVGFRNVNVRTTDILGWLTQG